MPTTSTVLGPDADLRTGEGGHHPVPGLARRAPAGSGSAPDHYPDPMTFSIVARSEDGTSWGVAVASKFLAVGSVVPAAVAGVGAIATQASANVAYKSEALSLLDDGLSAADAMAALLAEDEGREHRQVGLVDAAGRTATHTGRECLDWAGGLTGAGVSVQGNILTGEQVVRDMLSSWESGPAVPFAARLMAALRAGDAAGGDRRGRQSAALFVVRDGAGYGGLDDVAVDLRADDQTDPIGELDRLLELHELYLTASTEAERVELTAALQTELDQLAREQGHADLRAWVGAENHEMRVDEASPPRWIDPRVLDRLRLPRG